MKITKYSHSCLYIENNSTTFLIDPGNFSVQNGLTNNLFEKLDYLLITHEHEDHMDIGFIKELVKKFPHIIIKSNKSVVEILEKISISASMTSDEHITLTDIVHEELFDKKPPENVAITIDEIFTHVGDSFHFFGKRSNCCIPNSSSMGIIY